ncbi:MAG: sulfite exporter TauE/SafE family protein [Prochloraceae cyanobacterium]|nr:sulfite exporter TauE/SafE family protein [Prochloraceae cyanobacterium]
MFFKKDYQIMLIIALTIWSIWLIVLGWLNAFEILIEYWKIAVTMLFGSIIAGGSSLGGGAVAFPVLTKILHINPYQAKVFSLAIQSVGMSAASLAIIMTGVKVEWRVIFWASIGGFIGIISGSVFLAPLLPPDVIKITFTIMLTSIALTLIALNRRNRICNCFVPIWRIQEKIIFFSFGVFGGIMSGLAGNGIDCLTFSVMVLLFRINEKIATPTSVILMAINSLIGFFIISVTLNSFTAEVYSYWLAAIPVVVLGAPLGAILCSRLNRQTIANILVCLIFIELISSLLLIPLRPIAIYCSLSMLILFSYVNYKMYSNHFYENVQFNLKFGTDKLRVTSKKCIDNSSL